MESCQDHKYSLNSLQSLKALCWLLRDNADQILNGQMSVTMTSPTLSELTTAIDNLQDGLSPSGLSLDLVADDNDDHSNRGNNSNRDDDNRSRSGSRRRRSNRGNQRGREVAVASGSSSRTAAADLEEWNFHLQLVWDIISKAPVLVLYQPDNHKSTPTASKNVPSSSSSSSSSPSPLRLAYFTSLSHLEISRVPIRSIQDLLKMRERLRTLVIVNCVTAEFHLQDVLELCEQDVAVPMQWAVLKQLCVRHNNLHQLDGSLRLCPRLELLDLSRNRLTATDGYLGYLMELTHLDLSNNGLTALPSISVTAKKKLKILRLAGNRICHLKGLDEMTSLQDMDVSENLIASHGCLQPIKGLHRLDKLNMRGCPCTMKQDHRLLTLQYISTVSLSRKFFLDDRLVTHKEIQNSRAVVNQRFEPSTSRQQPSRFDAASAAGARSRRGADNSAGGARAWEAAGASQDVEDEVLATAVKKKKGRKKAKARTMDIPDMDTSAGGDLSSEATPSTTPRAASRMETLAEMRRQEVQETKAEMEKFRRHYGDNWLQAVDEQGRLPLRPSSAVDTPTSTPTTITSTTTNNANTPSTTKPLRKSGTDVAIVKNVTVDIHSDESGSAATTKIRNPRSERESAQNLGEKPPQDFSKKTQDFGAQNLTGEKVFSKEDLFLSSGFGTEDGMPSETLSQQTSRKNVVLVSGSGTGGGEGGENWNVQEQEEAPESSFRYTNQESVVVEHEDQSEPFIVTLASDPDDPFMVTVCQRYLQIKDICGVTKDKLDLQSLKAARTQTQEATLTLEREEGLDPQGQVKVILEFSSVIKDRQRREYIMEDLAAAQHLCQLVQPFVDARLQAARKKMDARHQCLKCSTEFTRGELTAVVYRETLPHTGSIQDFSSLAIMGEEKVKLTCPKCSSDHVVLMEQDDHPLPPPPSSTPTFSSSPFSSSLPSAESPLRKFFTRKQSMEQIKVQSPKAHSTPKKGEDNFYQHQSDREGAAQDKPLSRRRSNAFCNEQQNPLVTETRRRSDAVASLSEYRDRQLSSLSVLSTQSQDATATGTKRTSSVPVPGTDLSQTERVSIMGNSQKSDRVSVLAGSQTAASANGSSSQMASSGNSSSSRLASSANSAAAVASSVDSDITILNKRESAASMMVLSAQDTGSCLPASSWGETRDRDRSEAEQKEIGSKLKPELSFSSSSSSSRETGSKFSSDFAAAAAAAAEFSHHKVHNSPDSSTTTSSGDRFTQPHSSSTDVLSSKLSSGQTATPTPTSTSTATPSGSLFRFKPALAARTESSDIVLLNSASAVSSSLDAVVVETDSGRRGEGEEGGRGGGGRKRRKNGGDNKNDVDDVDDDDDDKKEEDKETGDNIVTPIGSPLSQSICSSMVSSVYNNSLLTPASSDDVSDAFVTADNLTITSTTTTATAEDEEEGRRKREGEGEAERSIYDESGPHITPSPISGDQQTGPTSTSLKKQSVSSEVEVLCLEGEEDFGQKSPSDFYYSATAVDDERLSASREESSGSTYVTVNNDDDNDDDDNNDDSIVQLDRNEDMTGEQLDDDDDADQTFHQLDHQLALYLMMSVFENDENFKFKVKTSISQYMILEEYEALVLVTNMKLYILRINSHDLQGDYSQALTLMEAQPLAELRRLDVGMGHMTLRLEFLSDCSCYTLVLRDSARTHALTTLISDQLQAYSEDTGVPVPLVVSEGADQSTLDNLSCDVLHKGSQASQPLRLYVLGYIARGHNPKCPMTFVVTDAELCVVRTNHQWPNPHHHTKVTVESVGKQFTVLERCAINTIAGLAVNQSNPRQLRVTFFDESSDDDATTTTWLVTMETKRVVQDFVRAVREPWESEFGVALDIELCPLDHEFSSF